MPPDHSFNALIIGILTSIPAILLALAALMKVVKGEGRMDRMEKKNNGEQERFIRSIIEDAWQEGRRAGIRENQALMLPPPETPPPAQKPAV